MTVDIEEMDRRNEELGDILLPEWVGRFLKFSYLGIGLFLLISSLTLMGCSSAGASDGGLAWQSATEVISEERVREIIVENSSVSDPSSNSEDMTSMLNSMLVAPLEKELLMVDFNSPLLTGRLGGLYAIYEDNGASNLIFGRYINKLIPEGVPVIQLSERTGINDYPCLIVNGLEEPTDTDILQSIFCYDGAEWNTVEQKVVSVSSFE